MPRPGSECLAYYVDIVALNNGIPVDNLERTGEHYADPCQRYPVYLAAATGRLEGTKYLLQLS